MKSYKKILIVTAFLLASATLMKAQSPPHPNNGGTAPTPGTNTPVGAGAPIADGTFILLAMALTYAGRKTISAIPGKE